jgi:hypothetical protein
VQLSVKQYDALERAIVDGCRVAVFRRGTEFIIIPERLALRQRRECIEARHPTTGAHLTLWIDEMESVEVMG